MGRGAALGGHSLCKTTKISRRPSKSRWRYESSKPLPPREQTVADQNLDRSGDCKPADAEPLSQSRFTVDARPGLTPRKILSKPIEELEVERPVEAGLKHSFCHVRPVIRLTGHSDLKKRNVKGHYDRGSRSRDVLERWRAQLSRWKRKAPSEALNGRSRSNRLLSVQWKFRLFALRVSMCKSGT